MRHVILALVACSAPAKPSGEPLRPHPPKQPSTELSPALLPLDWWLGDWEGPHGEEHWIAASGAIYGVGLAKDGSFEVMIVVGKATFTGSKPEDNWKSTYVTIWKQQPDGAWQSRRDGRARRPMER